MYDPASFISLIHSMMALEDGKNSNTALSGERKKPATLVSFGRAYN